MMSICEPGSHPVKAVIARHASAEAVLLRGLLPLDGFAWQFAARNDGFFSPLFQPARLPLATGSLIAH
jgi:hypothetical protein